MNRYFLLINRSSARKVTAPNDEVCCDFIITAGECQLVGRDKSRDAPVRRGVSEEKR
jgi:hypothetical protein